MVFFLQWLLIFQLMSVYYFTQRPQFACCGRDEKENAACQIQQFPPFETNNVALPFLYYDYLSLRMKSGGNFTAFGKEFADRIVAFATVDVDLRFPTHMPHPNGGNTGISSSLQFDENALSAIQANLISPFVNRFFLFVRLHAAVNSDHDGSLLLHVLKDVTLHVLGLHALAFGKEKLIVEIIHNDINDIDDQFASVVNSFKGKNKLLMLLSSVYLVIDNDSFIELYRNHDHDDDKLNIMIDNIVFYLPSFPSFRREVVGNNITQIAIKSHDFDVSRLACHRSNTDTSAAFIFPSHILNEWQQNISSHTATGRMQNAPNSHSLYHLFSTFLLHNRHIRNYTVVNPCKFVALWNNNNRSSSRDSDKSSADLDAIFKPTCGASSRQGSKDEEDENGRDCTGKAVRLLKPRRRGLNRTVVDDDFYWDTKINRDRINIDGGILFQLMNLTIVDDAGNPIKAAKAAVANSLVQLAARWQLKRLPQNRNHKNLKQVTVPQSKVLQIEVNNQAASGGSGNNTGKSTEKPKPKPKPNPKPKPKQKYKWLDIDKKCLLKPPRFKNDWNNMYNYNDVRLKQMGDASVRAKMASFVDSLILITQYFERGSRGEDILASIQINLLSPFVHRLVLIQEDDRYNDMLRNSLALSKEKLVIITNPSRKRFTFLDGFNYANNEVMAEMNRTNREYIVMIINSDIIISDFNIFNLAVMFEPEWRKSIAYITRYQTFKYPSTIFSHHTPMFLHLLPEFDKDLCGDYSGSADAWAFIPPVAELIVSDEIRDGKLPPWRKQEEALKAFDKLEIGSYHVEQAFGFLHRTFLASWTFFNPCLHVTLFHNHRYLSANDTTRISYDNDQNWFTRHKALSYKRPKKGIGAFFTPMVELDPKKLTMFFELSDTDVRIIELKDRDKYSRIRGGA